MVRDLPDELRLLRARCVVNATLQHAAAVAVRAYSDTTIADRCEDELSGVSEGSIKGT